MKRPNRTTDSKDEDDVYTHTYTHTRSLKHTFLHTCAHSTNVEGKFISAVVIVNDLVRGSCMRVSEMLAGIR